MLGDPVVFWFLRLLLFAVLTFCGLGISRTKKKSVAIYLWIAILAFALIEGLRWMRGTDYENYYNVFRRGITSKQEPLYLLFVNFVHSLRISPIIVFVFLSGFLLSGLGSIFKVRNLRYAAIWCLPLFYLMLGYQAENLVRQYLAITFLGYAFYYYYIDKTKWMLLCLLIAPFIHFATFLGSLFFLLFVWKRIDLKLNNVWWFVSIYCAAYFLWNPEALSGFAVYLSALDVDESANMSVYIAHADHHFTVEGSISAIAGVDKSGRSLINIALYFLTDLALIIVGFFACRNDRKLFVVYYFSYLGLLFEVLFGDIQVLMRFGYCFSWMTPILVALVAVYKEYGKYEILRIVVLFLLLVRYALYGIIFQIGRISMIEGCMFIWDK